MTFYLRLISSYNDHMKSILSFDKQEVRNREIIYTFEFQGDKYIYRLESDYIIPKLSNHLVANIGLALSPYLFNLDDFDEIHVCTSYFKPQQLKFFEDYLLKGMAEFRYMNNINPDKPIKIVNHFNPTDRLIDNVITESNSHKALLMFGGGKDSIVSKLILDDIDFHYDYFAVNANYPTKKIIQNLNEKKTFVNINLIMDKNVKKGKLSGHKPGSSIWAFVSLLASIVGRYNSVISSNEYSANFPQIKRQGGIDINHQYTKSYEFEINYTNYVQKYLVKNYRYFSLLRPLYELQIAKMFVNFHKYLQEFISCNVSYDEGKWCNNCPKCAFVYCIVAAFLEENNVIKIWGQHVLENEKSAKYIYDLISDNLSPLECIGTVEETLLALYFLKRKGFTKYIHSRYRQKILEILYKANISELESIIMGNFDRTHNINPLIANRLHFKKYS